MGISRRNFIKGSSSLFATLAASGLLRPSVSMAQASVGNNRNAIFIFWRGGRDGFYTLPYFSGPVEGALAPLRPNISVSPGSIISEGSFNTAQNGISDKIGFHPDWDNLRNVSGTNVLAEHAHILKSIGTLQYMGGSHEEKTRIWHDGDHVQQSVAAQGWFARLIERANMSSFQAWGIGNFGQDMRFNVLDGDKPTLIRNINEFNYETRNIYYMGSGTGSSDDSRHSMEVARQMLALTPISNPTVKRFKENAQLTHDTVPTMTAVNGLSTVGSYPSGNFGSQCRDAAKLLMAKRSGMLGAEFVNLPQIIMLEIGGMDTHGNQVNSLGSGDGTIDVVSRALAALFTDLLPNSNNGFQNIFADTVVCDYSEFGRTVRENGGFGTDHGWASNMAVFGGSVRPGVSGSAPSLSNIANSNRFTANLCFMSHIMATMSWLGIPNVNSIFPELTPPPPITLFT
ncbi:MAG: DUF1501 domain-containing protein [Bdellovibrionales bacterium]|nr:DUF1501 domain-containing protein [Bdellovibrionales bacterium]